MNQAIKNYIAGGNIGPYVLVRHGVTDGQVRSAVGGSEPLVGVSVVPSGSVVAALDRVDVGLDRQLPVEYGGAVTRGDPLTSDAVGRAIVAAPAAGVNVHIIGFADVSGISGDVVDVYVRPARIQG